MKCVSFHRTGFQEFGGTPCICEGLRWKGVLFCLETLWRIEACRQQKAAEIHSVSPGKDHARCW